MGNIHSSISFFEEQPNYNLLESFHLDENSEIFGSPLYNSNINNSFELNEQSRTEGLYQENIIVNNSSINLSNDMNRRTKRSSNEYNSELNKIENKSKNLGRKRKNQPIKEGQEENNSVSHDRLSDDNIMRKIKTNNMEFKIFNKLNNSLKNKENEFYRIHKDVSENLQKEFNEKLMNTKIRDLFYKIKISKKYRTPIDPLSNRKLIDKIEKEKKEIETMKILDMTYYQIIEKVIKEELDDFVDKILEKEREMNGKDNIETFISSLKRLLLGYKNWFENKKGRNRKPKKEKESIYIEKGEEL